jgi:hypothetical protein
MNSMIANLTKRGPLIVPDTISLEKLNENEEKRGSGILKLELIVGSCLPPSFQDLS